MCMLVNFFSWRFCYYFCILGGSTATCTFPSGYEQAASGADKAYMKKNGYVNFMEAFETCQGDGAHLVMLKKEQDVNDIRAFVRHKAFVRK